MVRPGQRSAGRQLTQQGRNAMSTGVMSAPPLAGRRAWAMPRVSVEGAVMAAAVVALIVLVVLPLSFLLVGSLRG